MIVVEIGCGTAPGPFFEGAAEHYAVDKKGPNVLEAYLTHPEMTPMIADATDMEFDDESVDVVLARDVFGDVGLGLSKEERYAQVLEMKMMAEDGRPDDAYAAMFAIEEQSALKKVDILREVGRILTVGGRLIVVEQESADVAERFFASTRQRENFDLLAMFDVEHNVPLEDVTPPNYAQVHGNYPNLQTWVATKKPRYPDDPILPDLGGAGVGQTAIELP